jgi:hypothetical protein
MQFGGYFYCDVSNLELWFHESRTCEGTPFVTKDVIFFESVKCLQALGLMLKERLIREKRSPYLIPVGGSNSLGAWSVFFSLLCKMRKACTVMNYSSS